MAVSTYLKDIIKEVDRNADQVSDDELRAAVEKILEAKRLFIAGAGRSGFAARAFSNRLMHLGLTVYFVGEPTTPAIEEGDLLFIGSGSGETGSLVVMAKKAKARGAYVGTITIHPEATIGSMADFTICLPGATPKSGMEDTCPSIQIMADAFEQLSWFVYDVIIHYLKERIGITKEEMFARHANLE